LKGLQAIKQQSSQDNTRSLEGQESKPQGRNVQSKQQKGEASAKTMARSQKKTAIGIEAQGQRRKGTT
jgi:hypothetical protein